jgi:allantoate deiminase
MHRVHALFREWMEAAGMQVHIDAVGNLRGLLPAAAPNAPRLLIGSHLDTIVNAGAFDGILGVVLGLALVEEAGKPFPFAIEIIGFSEEEGVRFAKPFLSSLAVIGELDADMLARTDRDGISFIDAIRNFGLDPDAIPSAILDDSAFAYLEFHIEQGPVLESENLALGIVDAIAGQSRLQFTFTGHANHAGTTPMGPLRHDALAAAAQWIVEVERYAKDCPGLVATVGKLDIPASAGNVIPGQVVTTLDVRHAQDATRQAAVAHYLQLAATVSASRGVTVTHATSLDQAAVPMDPALTAVLNDAVYRTTQTTPRIMISGAGHDAMIVARRLPAAMLFLRSPGGLSHHPDEAVIPGDVEAAVTAGVEFLRSLRENRPMLDQLSASKLRPKREASHA